MKIEQRRDGATERRILIGLITDSSMLGQIVPKWENGLLKSKWGQLIGLWCIQFHRKYGKAPGKEIESLFRSWADGNNDKDTINLVEKFLGGLSSEYEQEGSKNSSYLVDLAAEHFNLVKSNRLSEDVKDAVATGDLDKVFKLINKFNKVELGVGAGIDVLQDEAAIKHVFAEKTDSIIKYPGDLGIFYGDIFGKDCFVSFEGPEKSGKTWCLLDLAWRGMEQKRKVAFFEVGDMSQNQVMRRFLVRASKRPMKPGKVRYPTSISVEDEETFVEFEDKEFTGSLDLNYAWKACQRVLKKRLQSDESFLKLACYPNSTISVAGIKSVLETWERTGWGPPDALIIDYADILAPLDGKADTRDQINATWKALRAISQSLHCLVATATQSNAASYGTDILTKSNFSEDKRKRAHVTASIGINQTKEERGDDIVRHNLIVSREQEYSEFKCISVARCLALANPCVKSSF